MSKKIDLSPIAERLIVYGLMLVYVGMAQVAVNLDYRTSPGSYLSNSEIRNTELEPFPIGVNPIAKAIVEQPGVELIYQELNPGYLATGIKSIDYVWSSIQNSEWYPQLASPVTRSVVIWPGQRKEEVVKSFGDILRWDASEREWFDHIITFSSPILNEGKYLPGRYIAHRDATPNEVAPLISQRFQEEVFYRYPEEADEILPFKDLMTIASLLEREARDFSDMRVISGIIWNRLFIDMPLQLDASLQYVRGSNPHEPKWWPAVRPSDKFLNSPYNTYQNEGLPPAPIANPSPEAVLAALNPRETDCLFYFHDRQRNFFCSVTYEEHVAKLKQQYGRGK
jgi:cell division protein YceG involved in septum cleavage